MSRGNEIMACYRPNRQAFDVVINNSKPTLGQPLMFAGYSSIRA